MQASKAVQFTVLSIVFLGLHQAQAEVYSGVRSDLRMFSDSFISPAFEASQKTNYQFAGMGLKSSSASQDPLKMDIEGAVAVGAPLLNYLNISELYFQNRPSENDTIFIGRKLMKWSDLDQRWDLGLWQPIFQWNPLSPQQQGLSGIFWQTERDNASLTVFGSPFFLPNQGPSFEVSNGAFVDGSPWFRRPPDTVKIFNVTTPVDYTLEKLSESQVVFKTSYGAKLKVGSENGTLFQLSHMYKPSNQLGLGYRDLLSTVQNHAQVAVQPVVFYHAISAAEISQRSGGFRYGVSALLDRPQKDFDQLDDTWTRSRFSDALFLSPFVEWLQPSYILTLQALQIQGGEVQEIGDLANPSQAPLNLRYPFQEALKATLENRLSIFRKHRLASKFSYTYSDRNKFEYLQWELKCSLSSYWSLFGELELVRADDATHDNQNQIAQYRNLDRFLVGAAYVF